MWLASDGSMTWRDDQDGPPHWKPLPGENGSLH